jgi:hypothetical protein
MRGLMSMPARRMLRRLTSRRVSLGAPGSGRASRSPLRGFKVAGAGASLL